jgi:hypothetical protein
VVLIAPWVDVNLSILIVDIHHKWSSTSQGGCQLLAVPQLVGLERARRDNVVLQDLWVDRWVGGRVGRDGAACSSEADRVSSAWRAGSCLWAPAGGAQHSKLCCLAQSMSWSQDRRKSDLTVR